MVDEPQSEGERRVAELLRVNGELAAEMRDLALGRRTAPRSAQMPAARSVAKLETERDSLATRCDSLVAELEANRAELERLRRHSEELARQIHDQARHVGELSREVARLRGGSAGILRRIRARLLRR